MACRSVRVVVGEGEAHYGDARARADVVRCLAGDLSSLAARVAKFESTLAHGGGKTPASRRQQLDRFVLAPVVGLSGKLALRLGRPR